MIFAVLIFIYLTLGSARSAHAYLDPGTGSMVLQVVFGTVLAVGFTVKTYWLKLKNLFRKKID